MYRPSQIIVYSNENKIKFLQQHQIINNKVKINDENFLIIENNEEHLTLISDPIWKFLKFPLSFTTFAKYGLNIKEATLFSYFYDQIKKLKNDNEQNIKRCGIDLSGLYYTIIDHKFFAYFSYQMIILALPILKIKTVKTMKKLVVGLCDKGFIEYKKIKQQHLIHIPNSIENLIIEENLNKRSRTGI